MINVITLILVILNMNQTCLAESDTPKILIEKHNINELIEEKGDSKTYLTKATIYESTNMHVFWGSEMSEEEFKERDIEFCMVYYYTTISETALKERVSVAYFSKGTENYKIYATSFLENWSRRESENHVFKAMSFEATKGLCSYIGDSDNEDLLAVKVWKYIKNKLDDRTH